MKRLFTATAILLAGSFLASCSVLGPASLRGLAGQARFAVDTRNLTEVQAVDWQASRINAPGLWERRQAHIDAQMRAAAKREGGRGYALKGGANNWPDQDTGWRAAVNRPGVDPLQVSASAAKVTNGLACGMYWDAAATRRYVYALSNDGWFIRIPSDQTPVDTTNASSVLLGTDAADSFKFTSIVMNPIGTRAYCLSSTDATLYSINVTTSPPQVTSTLALGSAAALGGARFLAPALDAARSDPQGRRDVLYVPRNDGTVFTVSSDSSGNLSQDGSYNLATGVSPYTGCTGCSDYSDGGSNYYRLAASGVAYNGHYYIGDMAGNFYDYDVVQGSHVTYPISTLAGIAAPPALELQTGTSSALTQSNLSSTVVLNDQEARYAFVNVTRGAGPACAWIDLAQRTVVFSRPLYLDENVTSGNPLVYGKLADYDYDDTASTTYTVSMANGSGVGRTLTVATDVAGDLDATTALAQQFRGDRLQASTSGVPGGGGSTVFFRADASALSSAAVLTDAEVTLTGLEARSAVPPRFHAVGGIDANGSTGYYRLGTTTVWDSGASSLDASNAPRVFHSTYVTSPPLKGFSAGNNAFASPESFGIGGTYTWRVLDALAGPLQMNRLALAMRDPGTWGTGAGDAAAFDPTAAATTTLTLRYHTVVTRPSYPVETAPLIDAVGKRCYVQVANVLFCLKYDDPAAWTDTEFGQKHLSYQALLFGRDDGTGSGGADGTRNGTTYYRNTVSPVASFNFRYVFAQTHKGSGTAWDIAITRVEPSRTAGRSNDDLGTANRNAASNVTTQTSDSFHDGNGTADSNEGARTMMISPYDNIFTTGGDLYVSMTNMDINTSTVPAMYRFGTR